MLARFSRSSNASSSIIRRSALVAIWQLLPLEKIIFEENNDVTEAQMTWAVKTNTEATMEEDDTPHVAGGRGERNNPEGGGEEKEEKPKGFECAICLDGVTEPVVTMCGHLFW